MSSPERKRMKTKEKPSVKQSPPVLEPTPKSILSLPDDLLASCLARVSRWQYPSLSLVSKRFRSVLASPELYETRSSLGLTESCLYVCLIFLPDPIPRWFTLCRKSDLALTPNDTMMPSGYALAKLSTPHSRSAYWGLVAVGSEIYSIGGPVDEANEASSSVSILDCRSNTWREGTSLQVKRMYPHANVIDGKIYVTSGGSNSTSPEPMEVFDPKTQTWELVSTPPAQMSLGWDWVSHSYCVVENVSYVYHDQEFKWYDSTVRLWKVLKGLEGLPKLPRFIVTLADYGGKMAVLSDKVVASTAYVDKMIWCAVIALERRSDGEIWGKVEWSDAVLNVPKSCGINHALAATV